METYGAITSFFCSGGCEIEHYPDYMISYFQFHTDAIGVKVQWGFRKKTIGGIVALHSCVQFSSVQSLSCVWLFETPWTAARQASLSFTSSQSLLKLMPIESVMPSSHLILSSPSPPAPNPSQHQGLSQWVESTLCMRWPKYWSFSFSISPSSEHPGLISFRMDWLDLLAVQGTLKSLLQHHSSKASILQRSAFFTLVSAK